MAAKRFSIAVPIGGWHPLLPAALRSLAVQDQSIQVAVLDASGDPRVADALDRAGLAFAYRRAGPDAGQAAAIAEGWSRTEGEIVGWLNADDVLHPGAVAAAAAAFDGSGRPDVVYADSTILDIEGAVLGVHGQIGAVDESIAWRNPISQPSCFCRRTAVEGVGGLDRTLTYAMDWELWIRLQRAGARFERCPGYWSSVYWGAGTKTSQMNWGRLSELFGHTRRHAGLVKAARLMVGLATEAAPKGSLLRRWAGRRMSRPPEAGAGVYLAADANPREAPQPQARLPIVNPHDRPARVLEAQFDGAAVLIEAPDAQTVERVGPGVWRVTLQAAVAPGGAADLVISAQRGFSRLRRIVWLPPDTDAARTQTPPIRR